MVSGGGESSKEWPEFDLATAVCVYEVHWYEAHGIGKKEMKLKHIYYED